MLNSSYLVKSASKIAFLSISLLISFSLITVGGVSLSYAQFVPSQTTTFPPSVIPPTSSAFPSASLATQSNSFSPWFPSLPAIGCGGTFSLTIVGDVSPSGQTSSSNSNGQDNNNGHHGNDKRTLALQVNSAGGVDLTQESVKGRFFIGQHNIDNNQANNFDVKDVFNNCQVITFSR
ncbi:MAG TPA: hypothetical protein VFI73_05290 [Candidatus Nitrosopolaris sp.]|nr:hypothetical protein [Candidatus Nitrosopolaris sp.]